MSTDKAFILAHIAYTEAVYARINNNLCSRYQHTEIEKLLMEAVTTAHDEDFEHIGKNIYINAVAQNSRITLNASTCRVIAVHRIL